MSDNKKQQNQNDCFDKCNSVFSATPQDILKQELFNPAIPKTEREHYAVKEIHHLQKVLIRTTATLVAAISLLEQAGPAAKKAAPSDKMFDQMLDDYRKTVLVARTAFKNK